MDTTRGGHISSRRRNGLGGGGQWANTTRVSRIGGPTIAACPLLAKAAAVAPHIERGPVREHPPSRSNGPTVPAAAWPFRLGPPSCTPPTSPGSVAPPFSRRVHTGQGRSRNRGSGRRAHGALRASHWTAAAPSGLPWGRGIPAVAVPAVERAPRVKQRRTRFQEAVERCRWEHS